jgi:hypothetical protein
MLLPAGWLLRDWKFSDKRTQKYRHITKALLALWVFFGSLSTYYYWKQNNEKEYLKENVNELVNGKNELLKKTSNLSNQIDEYQKEIRVKDERIRELEKQGRILRSLEGNIECSFSANWSKGGHPGRLVPVSWNKAQFYARIFEEDSNDASTILFYLDSVEIIKLSESDLKVKLQVRANPGNEPFGQELDVLKRYSHLLVHIPFIDKGDTLDGKITLKNVNATFIVNGEKKAQIKHSDYFEIPLPDGNKLPAFQLNKSDLFHNIF